MLTLTRKSGECIRIGDDIRIVIREVRGRQVRIGIEADLGVKIHREEVYLRIRDEKDGSYSLVANAEDGTGLPPAVEAEMERTSGVPAGYRAPEQGPRYVGQTQVYTRRGGQRSRIDNTGNGGLEGNLR